MKPRVNKWLDLLDRAGWTAIQTTAGLVVAGTIFGGNWQYALTTLAVAVAGAVLKVKVGQNTGTDDTGALVGQPVIEPPPKAAE